MSLLSRLAVRAARAYGMLAQVGAPTNVSADYLVVAGGGGGGGGAAFQEGGGGGGAGGLLSSIATLSTLNTYSITVGAAGGGGIGNSRGSSGSNSVLSGTGLTTITAIGGGGGASEVVASGAGLSGGSGGGSNGNTVSGGAGTSGQGFAGGGCGTAQNGGGGGGGSGSVGADASGTNNGGNGGSSTNNSISGSSVAYAGGGGGGAYSGTGGTGGGAGAGNGASGGNNGSDASIANRGSGGGGGAPSSVGTRNGGSGSSGIVIISYTSATPKFVGGTITTSGGKQIHTFTSSGTLSPVTPITASYLVVAGGGGGAGASNGGGAGGAGGYQTSSTTIYSGATYVVTVGAGGTGGTSGTNGSDSVLSGTGITTVTSIGGGRANNNANGSSGGSGGGASSTNGTTYTGGAGTSGQGFAGGNSVSTSPFATGGGGGASAVGANGSGSQSGNGGAGTASSISGTSVTYAGGGGGGATSQGSTRGTGGAGGGGDGGVSGSNGVSGTPNLGGGGGGGSNSGGIVGGQGGSGIVIISYAGSQQFNGGLVTTSGGNTIHTFTSSGALTPLTNNLNNSLRFRSSASAYLNRTPSVTSNLTTWTWSGWVKLGALSTDRTLFGAASSGNAQLANIHIAAANSFEIDILDANSTRTIRGTTAVYRDPSAWYHVVFILDTTQATAANRMRLYINGNQISLDVAIVGTYPAQNANCIVNSTSGVHNVGRRPQSNDRYFDGYMADFNFIDGQALEPYYFGNNDANGVWKPIQYKGTFGTNGFYLTFGNTTSTTTLGYDSSPNGNNWTTNNISLTAGTTYDAMTDVPTNTSATVANYAVLDPLDPTTSGNMTLSNANLTMTTSAANRSRLSTIYVPSGKWYAEVTFTTSSGSLSGCMVGLCRSEDATSVVASYLGSSTNSYGYNQGGDKYNAGSASAYGASYTTGDIIGIAFDADAGTVTFYKNNTSQGTAFTGLSTSSLWSIGVSSGISSASANIVSNINFGQRPFNYTPPTGFVALNTFNLPTPTILQGNKYMDATLYTGTGTALNVVNQGQFRPDFVWVKNRTAADSSGLYDSVRGVNQRLISNLTNAEDTSSGVSAFNSNGFSLGTAANYNTNGNNFVGWSWQAGQGSTSSNTSGTITSTVSVNTTAGFSIVTYTGTGANATVGHGLGVAPAMVIVKRRSSTGNWNVRHVSITAANSLYLNLTNASQSDPTVWNSTVPTSTVFSIGTDTGVNASGATYVAYCWAEIAGFSKISSYTGNGSSDGPFVYCGFRPRFVMFKNTATTQNWIIMDTARDPINKMTQWLFPNTSGAEYTDSNIAVDYLSNGFKLRNVAGTELNGNGNTIIFAAFAEHPFKNSNAR